MKEEIEKAAEKEMSRMKEIFSSLKIVSKDKNAKEFHDFANNYFKDGIHFFNEKKFIESFEAFIISWSYIDIGLKLNLFSVSKEHEKFFTA
jgi:hypothetical protein